MMSSFVFPSLLYPLLRHTGPLLSRLLCMWLPNKNQKQHPNNVHDGLLEAQLNTVQIDQCGLNPVVLCLCKHVLKLEPWDLWEASREK